MAGEDAGIEASLPELQRRCVLLVARDIVAHIRVPMEQHGHLHHYWCKLIRNIIHRVWGPAMRMVCADNMDWEPMGVQFRGQQLLDVCLVVLGSTVSVASSMPQGHPGADVSQLRGELAILARMLYQQDEFDYRV